MAGQFEPFSVVFYHDQDLGKSPALDFLCSLPDKSRAKAIACLAAVAAGPPMKFRGGGIWEAMHGDMAGWFEIRFSEGSRIHHRLFCLLDNNHGFSAGGLLVVVTGLSKRDGEVFTNRQYKLVDGLGQKYLDTTPRSFSSVSQIPLD